VWCPVWSTIFSILWILKNFKDRFFKVTLKRDDPLKRFFFNEDFSLKFPLYWQYPAKFKSVPDHLLLDKEKADIKLLRGLSRPIDCNGLITTQIAQDPLSYFKGERSTLDLFVDLL